MRSLCSVVVFLMAITTASAQQIEPSPADRPPIGPGASPEPEAAPRDLPMPTQVVAAADGFVLTDRVLFVVDVSGSMEGRLQEAVDNVLTIVQSPTDSLRVGVVTFTTFPVRWEGCPTPCPHAEGCHSSACVRRGWAAVPLNYREVVDYITRLDAAGDTAPEPALKHAFADRERRLTIVLVTDGEFNPDSAIKAVREGQLARAVDGLPPAALMVWGVGCGAQKRDGLIALAHAGGGGMWVRGGEQAEAPPELDQDQDPPVGPPRPPHLPPGIPPGPF